MPRPSSPRIIITGGAGFIGCNLALAFNARGREDLLIVDVADSDGKRANLRAIRHRDVMGLEAFRKQFRSGPLHADVVYHLGACSSTTEANESYLMDNNFAYTRELCESCLAAGTRFVYASSAATYGDGALGYSDDPALLPTLHPLNLYGLSKHRFDLWGLEHGHLARIAGLKYFNVYGPHEDHKGDMRSVVHKAHEQILRTGRLQLFKSARPDYRDGEQLRDFVCVKDAVNATLFFGDHPDANGLFNCGTGRARTWLDLGRAVFSALGRPPAIDFIDMPPVLRDKYQYFTQADTQRLRGAGYRGPFTELEDGVRDYVQNYLQKAS